VISLSGRYVGNEAFRCTNVGSPPVTGTDHASHFVFSDLLRGRWKITFQRYRTVSGHKPGTPRLTASLENRRPASVANPSGGSGASYGSHSNGLSTSTHWSTPAPPLM
jgi:hypothetical protein